MYITVGYEGGRDTKVIWLLIYHHKFVFIMNPIKFNAFSFFQELILRAHQRRKTGKQITGRLQAVSVLAINLSAEGDGG